MKCADCKFWLPVRESIDPDAGECHRRAPAPIGEAALVILGTLRARDLTFRPHVEGADDCGGGLWDRKALWPATLASDFCGEFVPAKQASWV